MLPDEIGETVYACVCVCVPLTYTQKKQSAKFSTSPPPVPANFAAAAQKYHCSMH